MKIPTYLYSVKRNEVAPVMYNQREKSEPLIELPPTRIKFEISGGKAKSIKGSKFLSIFSDFQDKGPLNC